MEKFKHICKKIFILPLGLVLVLTIISASLLVFVFLNGYSEHPLAYVSYVVAFYGLTVLCVALYKRIPGIYRKAKEWLFDNKYSNKYLTDVVFKTRVNTYASLAVNLLYIATNAVSAVVYNTHWFAIFAIYYWIMAVMRFILSEYMRKNNIGENIYSELKRARACAYILLTVNLILSGVVLMMIYYDRGFSYQGFLIYVMAVYTFFITITAVKDVIRYRRYRSPVMSVAKVIKLAASLFSMLFLETAMFSQFGQETPEETKRIMIMATGAGISVIVVSVSVYLIVRYSKEIKSVKTIK